MERPYFDKWSTGEAREYGQLYVDAHGPPAPRRSKIICVRIDDGETLSERAIDSGCAACSSISRARSARSTPSLKTGSSCQLSVLMS
jgi:hypothetical protein